MKIKVGLIFSGIVCLFLTACVNQVKQNTTFENTLTQKYCGDDFFNQNLEKIKKNDDVIYTGLNAGLIARNCGDFNKSNVFFDAVEETYKYDVDLENVSPKAAKFIGTTLLNDNIVDYDGSLYERIMVNIYKALNYMEEDDYENARVEFNRALMRQDKAKEYFAKEIEKNRADLDKAKEDKNYDKNMNENSKVIEAQYDNLFKEFDTTKNFINPYATYLASIFFFMDKDYRKAADLFREVSIIYPKNKTIKKEAKIFKEYATKIKVKKAKKYVFVVYENGFGVVKDEFALTLPFIVDKKIISTNIALQTLKKREASFANLNINGQNTNDFVDLDNIVATEFKINMPAMIAKALAQTIVKTTLNVAVANNDSTGGWLSLATAVATAVTNKADVRSWRGLPKSIAIATIENDGNLEIKDPQGNILFQKSLDKNKNALVVVRSFALYLPASVAIMEK
ncbi:COG3014 family protein [Campylobacter jejuni]|uniref:COG3014 family protein n=1 Tax=Campylobacter jejuni TaxID=197 RepID=UPI000B40374C|nr:COG3014 family protein [Campylobacter jejuni]HDV7423198.1 COG3014 family protein [Campylobacter jejuni]HEB7710037.1 COG3014 family protein [Campylobacter jejuni]